MQTTPKSLRLTIAIVGRMNVGKSSLLNYLAGQDVAITAPLPGTTTDVVEKPMEFLPLGPVLFLDTAGMDDVSELGRQRVARTMRALERADVAVLLLEVNQWGAAEEQILARAKARSLPLIAVVGKCDLQAPTAAWLAEVQQRVPQVLLAATVDLSGRETFLTGLRQALLAVCPDDFLRPPPLMGDLVPPGGLVVLVVPIDTGAPQGRLILPQVQTIRDALDHDAAALVVKERELAHVLGRLTTPPELVVCDSQVVQKMVADVPLAVPCTTFSILFARLKGDLQRLAAGAAAVDRLGSGDKVLIAESCSHHAREDDIGRVKIPRWLRQHTGVALQVDTVAGRDFPADLSAYKLVIQCGGCMITRREVLYRIQQAQAAGVPITNYGLCIAQTQGVLRRVLSPFPAALAAWEEASRP
ncbi:MAG: [FeFe] hydrogenase H-cluster maturation GTPase HydF [bacterium]